MARDCSFKAAKEKLIRWIIAGFGDVRGTIGKDCQSLSTTRADVVFVAADERKLARRHIPGGDDCPGESDGSPGLSHFLAAYKKQLSETAVARLAVVKLAAQYGTPTHCVGAPVPTT
jgi:hypothetical protein